MASMRTCLLFYIPRRYISTTRPRFCVPEEPEKNFSIYPLANVTGQYDIKHTPRPLLENEFNYPLFTDTFKQRYPGYWIKGRFHYVKEMEPELVVPDLTGFKLKPYVSHRTQDITQSELTAKHLFNLVYADDIVKQFKDGKKEINMTCNPEVARLKAKQTGSDLFSRDNPWSVENERFE